MRAALRFGLALFAFASINVPSNATLATRPVGLARVSAAMTLSGSVKAKRSWRYRRTGYVPVAVAALPTALTTSFRTVATSGSSGAAATGNRWRRHLATQAASNPWKDAQHNDDRI